MRKIYSREMTHGRVTQYHGHVITPEGVTLTLGEADRLISHFISTSANDTRITKGTLHEGTLAEPGVYIGSGVHNRRLADLAITGVDNLKLYAVSRDGEDVFYVKDIERDGT